MTQAAIGRGVKITYYGHSAFKLSGAGVNVLIDPWLSNPLLNTPLDQVGQVDLILVTHGHGDHVGETVPLAGKTGATVVAIHELSQILAEQGVARVAGMNKGGTVALAGLKITMTQAVHSSSVDVGGKMVPAGEAGGARPSPPRTAVAPRTALATRHRPQNRQAGGALSADPELSRRPTWPRAA